MPNMLMNQLWRVYFCIGVNHCNNTDFRNANKSITGQVETETGVRCVTQEQRVAEACERIASRGISLVEFGPDHFKLERRPQ